MGEKWAQTAVWQSRGAHGEYNLRRQNAARLFTYSFHYHRVQPDFT